MDSGDNFIPRGAGSGSAGIRNTGEGAGFFYFNHWRLGDPLWNLKMNLILLTTSLFILFACVFDRKEDQPKTSYKREVQTNKNLNVEEVVGLNSNEDSVLSLRANIVSGNENVFYYERYEDHGEEGWGLVFAFEFDRHLMQIDINNEKNPEINVITYGTGFSPSGADTLAQFDIRGSLNGDYWEFSGTIGNSVISGKYDIQ